MGVAFFDQENIMPNNNTSTNTNTITTHHASSSLASTIRIPCNCNVCNPQAETQTTATQTTSYVSSALGENNFGLRKNNIFKEIIGNSKEVKIDSNAYNLRIVGNNNRIRIKHNVGDLVIVGNATRLKIKLNHGEIKYTGNDGRICLGEESSVQLVDYSGCNGILKVLNAKNFDQQQKSSQNQCNNNNTNCRDSDSHKSMGNTYVNKQFIGIKTNKPTNSTNNNNNSSINNKKSNCKSASYNGSSSSSCSCSSSGSSCSSSDNFKFQFNMGNVFNRKNSMPNLSSTTTSSSTGLPNAMRAPTTIVQHVGNIVITNSSNVCITPFSY